MMCILRKKRPITACSRDAVEKRDKNANVRDVGIDLERVPSILVVGGRVFYVPGVLAENEAGHGPETVESEPFLFGGRIYEP
jgi:hypothetical protein